jgi:GUN4-like
MSAVPDETYEQLSDRVAKLENKLQNHDKLLTLSERIDRLESNLIMVTDLYRFQPLQQLLKDKNWQEADRETIRALLAISGQAELESITPEDVRHFPCSDLSVLDRLWTIHSDGRFGFSVQAKIYQEVGGSLETTIAQDNALIKRFGERVGWWRNERWQKCDELDYTLSAPVGCHPSRWWNSPFGSKMTNFFFARLITCGFSS